MSRRMSISLLKNYRHKFILDTNFYSKFYLSKSVSNIQSKQKFTSNAAIRHVQVSKQITPLINYSIDDILSSIDSNITATRSVLLLKVLRTHTLFGQIDKTSFKDDSRFRVLCDVFERGCSVLLPHQLISGLRSLLEVGVSPLSTCVTTAEEYILKNITIFSSFNLIGCLYYHHKFVETGLQEKVVSVLVSMLQGRIQEISTPAEVMMLPHIIHLFQNETEKELEQKIAKFMPLLTLVEMNKFLCLLAEKSCRNIVILSSLAYHLRQKTEKPDLKGTIDMFYAFKKLNFFDPELFSHLLNHLEAEVPTVQQASLISGLLTTCGHMRWKHEGILDACGNWIKNHLDSCRMQDIVAYVITVATLNYTSSLCKNNLKLILPHLTIENITSSNMLLDVAWSLAILDCIPKELLLSVLSQGFYRALIDSSDAKTSIGIQLKLLNLKGVLKRNFPECFFGCDLYLEPIKLPESGTIENCRRHVIKVLSNFVPKDKCMSLNEVTDTGVFIDAEFIMSEKQKPLSLESHGIMAKCTTSSKPLPTGYKRLALLVMFHKDYTHYIQSLTGVNELGARLLADVGFTVVKIPYDEFSTNKTEVQKAKYLLQKISTVMRNA